MSISIQDRHLIDRYLQGELSGIELESFMQRMNAEGDFKKEVELQNLIYAGIQKAHHEKLKQIVLSSLDYRKQLVPFGLKMILTFLIVTGLGITLWFYVGTDSANKEQANSWFAFLKSKNSEAETKQELPKQKQEISKSIMPAEDSSSAVASDSQIQTDSTQIDQSAPKMETDSVASSGSEEDIIVKQDKLLISANLLVEDKTQDKDVKKDESLANEAAKKLNPAADLPEEEKVSPNYLVEFWVSPINYRGYKMSKNKLILFGIEEPDAVKLYRVNEALYMSYLKEYYRLNDSFDFVSYQKLKDSEIPLAIK